MMKWKKWLIAAVAAVSMHAILIPGQATEAGPSFENPDGMTVDLIYYYEDIRGSEHVIERIERVIIPAGTGTVTVEIQQRLIPEGHTLKDPKDQPLTEDTLEVKIRVLSPSEETGKPEEKPEDPDMNPGEPDEKPTEPEEKPTEPEVKPTEPEVKPTEPEVKPTEPEVKPTEPEVKPTEPEEKPTEPEVKPTEPEEKPTEPEEKPTEPEGKPEKPAEKPAKPAEKPSGKPNPTNPKTEDANRPGLWIFLSVSTAWALLFRKRIF